MPSATLPRPGDTSRQFVRQPAPTPAIVAPSGPARRPEAGAQPTFAFYVFCLYTFVLFARPQDFFPFLMPFRMALVLTVVTSLVTLFQGRGNAPSPFRHKETKLFFFLFVVMCVGVPFSTFKRASFNFIILGYVVNVIYFFLFVTHVDTVAKWRQIAFVLMLSALVFSALGMRQGTFIEGRYDIGAANFDPNDVAFFEVSLLSFGLAVFLGSFGGLVKALTLGGVLVSVLLALYTGSRGGLLGLGAVFLMFMCLRLPGVKKSHKVIVLVFLAAAVSMNADKLNTDRYQTITDLGEDYNSYDETGRVQIWTRGLQLLGEDPLTGVGANEFPEAIGKMRLREHLLEQWQAPHNSYIEILVETGVFGGVAFIVLIVTCLTTFNDLRRRPRSVADRDLQMLPGVLLIGFVGQLVAAFFLSQAYSIVFTLSFAAAASLKGIAPSTSDKALGA